MHVVGSVAVAYAVFDSDRLRNGWLRAVTVLLAAVISVSILFVKQHSALDLIGALVLCLPIWLGLNRWRRVSRLRKSRAASKNAA
jgi:membrane-associated phospholipid phosphatase